MTTETHKFQAIIDELKEKMPSETYRLLCEKLRHLKEKQEDCRCIHHGYEECMNDFNCAVCGRCMNWRGYEEGTTHCGCYQNEKMPH